MLVMDSALSLQIRELLSGKVKENEPMSAHTSFGIGGPADILAVPQTRNELFALLDLCATKNIPYMIIGRGTNLLVRDGGISGVVIILDSACENLDANGTEISAGAGVSLNRLVKFAAAHGLQGLEFCAGIPGCVGGGLATNAGAWGKNLCDAVKGVLVYDPPGRKTRRVMQEEIEYGYRKSNLASFGVILEAEFTLNPAEPREIFGRMQDYLKQKASTQPLGFKSAGSVFKNPTGHYAGVLIESLGFKGYARGGAVVSDLHANFIVNTGAATASDVLTLIAEIKQRAHSATDIDLEEEIEVVGRD